MRAGRLLALFIAVATAGSATTLQPEGDHETQAIKALLVKYEQAVNAKNLDAIVGLYAADGAFVPSGAPARLGVRAIRENYSRNIFGVYSSLSLTVTPVEVAVLGDRAFARTRIAGTGSSKRGDSLPPVNSKALFVLERSKDGPWAISRYVFSRSDGWESAPWEGGLIGARRASELGKKSNAEDLCGQALQYVNYSTVQSLFSHAALLTVLKRSGAETAYSRAENLFKARNTPGPGSVYLGFVPSDELMRYAALLRELDSSDEAGSIELLAAAEMQAQRIHFMRLSERERGGDPRGKC